MGIYDDLLNSAIPKDEYFGRDNGRAQQKKSFEETVKAKSHKLPKPFNKKDNKVERDIQKEIIAELKKLNIFYKRVSLGAKIVQGKSGAIAVANELAGYPDIMIQINGLHIPLEIKRRGGILSGIQHAIMLDLQRHGAYPIVTTSVDIIPLLRLAISDPVAFKKEYQSNIDKNKFTFPVY